MSSEGNHVLGWSIMEEAAKGLGWYEGSEVVPVLEGYLPEPVRGDELVQARELLERAKLPKRPPGLITRLEMGSIPIPATNG